MKYTVADSGTQLIQWSQHVMGI